MAQCEMVDTDDDELVSSYFELDRASAPSSNSPGGYCDAGRLDENISGFEPIRNRINGANKLECGQNLKENYSGGVGCYVWPSSSQISISESPPMEEVFKGLGIDHEQEARRAEMAVTAFLTIELNENQKDYFPSKHSGIDWKKELRQVYRPT
ncbi:uncharacterized protein F4807DRAFT_465527 [Annulohypoxylon truncatum]|uniref:uncharacterized protein n=1 Tax=Annulohypoxylon truncatum TaxID=327061 RepID=UPI002008CA1D|nr:uncharacterized protein F4807DRAFT_465527 [Annulohypoxylon truncatum]KAI1204615.1 hypothetical protein F4807DRAFT_465527 [Annulohypoxylon truncatum]